MIPGQGSGIPEHSSGPWHVPISLQSCDYSSYWDTRCNFDLWNCLHHHHTVFPKSQAQSKRLKEGTGVWALPLPGTGVIYFWRKAEGPSHSSIRTQGPWLQGEPWKGPLFLCTQATFTVQINKMNHFSVFQNETYIICTFRRTKTPLLSISNSAYIYTHNFIYFKRYYPLLLKRPQNLQQLDHTTIRKVLNSHSNSQWQTNYSAYFFSELSWTMWSCHPLPSPALLK